jgi:hypothetical protein
VNAETLKDGTPDSEALSNQDIFKNNLSLRHIDIVQGASQMANTLRLFGNLRHLLALQTISLHFEWERFNTESDVPDERWLKLDKVLKQAGNGLKEVEIYAHTDKERRIPPDAALVRSLLPSVAQKISVYPTLEADVE